MSDDAKDFLRALFGEPPFWWALLFTVLVVLPATRNWLTIALLALSGLGLLAHLGAVLREFQSAKAWASDPKLVAKIIDAVDPTPR